MDNIYILISVCDREILTETFKSLHTAQKQMHKEMIEWAGVDSEVFSNIEYEDVDFNFGFGEIEAWANTNNCDYDWRIISIGGNEND